MSRIRLVILATAYVIAIRMIANTTNAADAPTQAPPDAPPKLPANSPLKSPVRWPGPQPDGQTLLFNQWSLKPAGRQIPLGHFPVNIAMHPSEPWAAVLHCGYRQHEIVIVDLKHQEVASRVSVPQAFYGITFDPAGKRLFASGGEFEVVHEYAFADGRLSDHHELRIADAKSKQIPAGLACSADGKTLYVACAWGSTVARVALEKPGQVDRFALPKDSYPYAIVPSRDGKRLFVSLWGKSAVAVVDAGTWRLAATWPIQRFVVEDFSPSSPPSVASTEEVSNAHPTEMVLSPNEQSLYVACANLSAVVVIGTHTGALQEVLTTSLYPNAPNGSTPSSLTLSSDGKVLLVANSDNNNLAVFDVSQSGKSRSLGFIPTGWYPTSVRFGRPAKGSPGSDRMEVSQEIYVANGKGLGSRANPNGPNPAKSLPGPKKPVEYIGGLFSGTLGIIDPPSPEEMARNSQQARALQPFAVRV